MSISPTVGAFSTYLSQIKLSGAWHQSKGAYDHTIERVPMIGSHLLELSRRLRASVVRFAQPGQLFEDLGITYIGVVPGHDLHALLETLGAALALPGTDDRPRPDPEGPRATSRPRRTRSGSTARPCRRWPSRPPLSDGERRRSQRRGDADRVDDR